MHLRRLEGDRADDLFGTTPAVSDLVQVPERFHEEDRAQVQVEEVVEQHRFVDVQSFQERLVEERDRTHLLLAGERAEISSRSEEHTSELQSLMRNSYDVFCLTKNKTYKLEP